MQVSGMDERLDEVSRAQKYAKRPPRSENSTLGSFDDSVDVGNWKEPSLDELEPVGKSFWMKTVTIALVATLVVSALIFIGR